MLKIFKLSDNREMAQEAIKWFSSKWNVPKEAYQESIEESFSAIVPSWYVCLDGDRIVAGMGVIENDFHDRKDLTPNVCAVYTEEEYRCRGIAGRLLNFVCHDMAIHGIDTLYLLTDHTGFYERYGWNFFCMAMGDGEDKPSRMYVHREKTCEIKTDRLNIHPATQDEMVSFIAGIGDEDLRRAYQEMLDGCLENPHQWEWYAIWMIELKDGTHIGELCFKGITEKGTVEIGYGIAADSQGCGYATEAVSALTEWALRQPSVMCVMAETEGSNIASQKVLNKAGFLPTGGNGEEGPLYFRHRIIIRPEEHKDYKSIVSLILRSFQEGTDYSDGTDIIALVEEIRDSKYYIPDLSFVAELDDKVVGHFMFSHFPLSPTREGRHDDDGASEIVMLAPVSVHADYFHQGIGSAMIKMGIEKVKETEYKGITVEGDYNFYNKVGFKTSSEYNIFPTSGWPMKEPRCMMCQETYDGSLNGIHGYIVYDMYFNA